MPDREETQITSVHASLAVPGHVAPPHTRELETMDSVQTRKEGRIKESTESLYCL